MVQCDQGAYRMVWEGSGLSVRILSVLEDYRVGKDTLGGSSLAFQACLLQTAQKVIISCSVVVVVVWWYFGTSSQSVHVEQVAIILIIIFSLSLLPAFYFSIRRGGARALNFSI